MSSESGSSAGRGGGILVNSSSEVGIGVSIGFGGGNDGGAVLERCFDASKGEGDEEARGVSSIDNGEAKLVVGPVGRFGGEAIVLGVDSRRMGPITSRWSSASNKAKASKSLLYYCNTVADLLPHKLPHNLPHKNAL